MNAPATEFVGLFDDLPAEDYHAAEALSASGAKKLLRSPAHFKLWRDQKSEPTDSMIFGTAVHIGVLEPHRWGEVVALPKLDRRTKAGKEAAAEFEAANAGKIILDADAYSRAESCIAAVNAHPAAQALLQGARREVSAFWYDGQCGVPCKARFDALAHGGIPDLKTTTDASPEAFARNAASLLYHVQAAAYNSAHEHVLHASMAFFAFIVVESEPPHGVAVYTLPGDAVKAGARLWNRALARYAEIRRSGQFPGYPETIQSLRLPRWALQFNEEV